MTNYILSKKGLYYMLRARFNKRDFTPNLKPPRKARKHLFAVWLKDNKKDAVRMVIWDSWADSLTGLAIRDKACIDEIFEWNYYELIKYKELRL